MPTVQIDATLNMYYEDHCFSDPWRQPEVVLLIHGIAESSVAWFGWVPHLAREFRVLRPDLRGFGRSTIPGKDFKWSIEILVRDIKNFLDFLQINSAHVIGAKIGGSIAFQFAAQYPERTRTLTVVSGPVRASGTGGTLDLLSFPNRIRKDGIRKWAAETQRARLGSEVPEEQIAWWTNMMSQSKPDSCVGITSVLDQLSMFDILERIQAPTLIITTDHSSLQSLETVREVQKKISNSELLILQGDSYHIAAARPDECAIHAMNFIRGKRK
jgi:3-oxoadipate enol-lactonase